MNDGAGVVQRGSAASRRTAAPARSTSSERMTRTARSRLRTERASVNSDPAREERERLESPAEAGDRVEPEPALEHRRIDPAEVDVEGDVAVLQRLEVGEPADEAGLERRRHRQHR